MLLSILSEQEKQQLDKIKEAWHYIYGSWFLANDVQRGNGFDFEIYYDDRVEIYIPMIETKMIENDR